MKCKDCPHYGDGTCFILCDAPGDVFPEEQRPGRNSVDPEAECIIPRSAVRVLLHELHTAAACQRELLWKLQVRFGLDRDP